MKKYLRATILGIPTPVVMACVRCVYYPCPPCTVRAGQTCFRCGTCQAVPGCEPR
jgi:hypothetical protein